MPLGSSPMPSPRTQAASPPGGSPPRQQTGPTPAVPSRQTPPATPLSAPPTQVHPPGPIETLPQRCTPCRSRRPRPLEPPRHPSSLEPAAVKRSSPDPATTPSITPPDSPPTAASPARCATSTGDRAGHSFRARSPARLAGEGKLYPQCERESLLFLVSSFQEYNHGRRHVQCISHEVFWHRCRRSPLTMRAELIARGRNTAL